MPSAPRSGEATTPTTGRPALRETRVPPAAAPRRARPGRGRSRRARPRPRPASNCGFTSSTRSASARVQRREGGRHGQQRDEGQIGDREVDRTAEVVRGERADVHPLADRHPRIGSQGPRQLTPADVDRVDVGGAPLQEAVGEPAGRRAGVEGAAPVDDDRKRVERRRELLAAAGDVARLGNRHPDGLVGAHLPGRRRRGGAPHEHATRADRVDRPGAARGRDLSARARCRASASPAADPHRCRCSSPGRGSRVVCPARARSPVAGYLGVAAEPRDSGPRAPGGLRRLSGPRRRRRRRRPERGHEAGREDVQVVGDERWGR